MNQPQPGFFKVVLISFLLHAIALSAGFLLVEGEKGRIFYTPVFTVELIAPPPPKAKPKKVKKAPAKAPAKKVKKKKVEKKAPKVAKKPAKPKKKPPEKKPKTTLEERLLVGKAITRIEKKTEEEEERELISSRIEEIKRKAEAEKKELETLKKDLAEEERIKKRLEALKKELAKAQTETKTVEVETPATTPAVKAPRRITRELFELEFKAYYNKVGAEIQSKWVYTGAARRLEAWLYLKITRSGELKALGVERPSGNSLFDESALRAVKKAAPFPPLPEGLEGDFLDIGVRFCPGGCRQLL